MQLQAATADIGDMMIVIVAVAAVLFSVVVAFTVGLCKAAAVPVPTPRNNKASQPPERKLRAA